MRKRKNYLIGLIVVFALLLCFAFSTSALEKTGQCGDNVYWSYNEATGELVISGVGEMYSYEANYGNGLPWKGIKDDIITVTVKENVTSISGYAFFGCNYLENVEISKSVTRIGSQAFGESKWYDKQPNGLIYINNVCYRYKGTVAEGETLQIKQGTVSISSHAFYNQKNEFKVIIPKGVKYIDSSAFEKAENTEVVVPDTVEYIGYGAFLGGCEVYYDGSLRDWCNNILDRGLSYITGNLYINGRLLSDLVIIPRGVTEIRARTFYNCAQITEVILNNKVEKIGGQAFYGCNYLKSIVIPKSVTEIGANAFYYCTRFTDVYYMGSEEEWNSITIHSQNSDLNSATIHFNYVPQECYHIITKSDEGIKPTCLEDGCTEGKYCEDCESWIAGHEIIKSTGHSYGDDNICDKCGDDRSENCSCNCHKSGFMGFIWKIVLFFWKLFKMNAVCDCGAAHY